MRILRNYERDDWVLVFDSEEEAQIAKEILEDLITDKNSKNRKRGA